MKMLIFISVIIPLKLKILTQYELDWIKNLPTYSNTINVIKDINNQTKCISKIDLNIFAFEKEEILSSESFYYPNKTELIKNINNVIKDNIIIQNQFILTSCLFFILDNFYEQRFFK